MVAKLLGSLKLLGLLNQNNWPWSCRSCSSALGARWHCSEPCPAVPVLPAPAARGNMGSSGGHCTREKMLFFWVTVWFQACKRSPDNSSEQPAQRTSPSAAVMELGEEQGRVSSQITTSPAQTLRAQLHAGSTTWPLACGKGSLFWLRKWAHTCLLGTPRSGGNGAARTTSSYIKRDRGTSETGGLKASTGDGNPAGSMKLSLMGHQPKAPEQTLPAALPSPSVKHKCFKGDSTPLTGLLHPPVLPTNSPRLARSP